MEINLTDAYKLPWTKEDNPNGWIEPTTFCQIKCPGCYRGLAEKNPVRIHEKLEKMKSEIDELILARNIQTLSIAGGEPLLYPQLDELIDYSTKKGLKTKVYTNGFALTKNRLIGLKNSGLTEAIIHLDRFQQRSDIHQFVELNELRNKYCDIFREVEGVNLGFIMPVSENNLSDLKSLTDFSKKNNDIINLIVLIVYKNVLPSNPNSFINNQIKKIDVNKLIEFLSIQYNSKPCAYLCKIQSKNLPAWVLIIPVFFKNEVIGYIDGKMYKHFQQRYYKAKKKHFITIKGNKIKYKSLIWSVLRNGNFKMFFNIVKVAIKNPKSIKNKLRYQVILVIDGPEMTSKGWNLCEGCPDAMLYYNKLVPSCLLERIKCGENILIEN